MCNPAAVQAAVVVVGTVYSAQQQQAQGRYQRGVADYNARVAENEAEEARNLATEQENEQRRRTAALIAKQRAQLGAAGVDLESGSPLQLQEDTAMMGEIDALRIRSNLMTRAESLETGASLTRDQGRAAQRIGGQQAVGTLLSGTSQFFDTGVADKWFTPNSAANQGNTP